MTSARDDLVVVTGRLVDRLAAATPAWYAARPLGDASRAEVLRALIATLAGLGRDAGSGVPPGTSPPVLGDHALGSQLTLLAWELARAPADRAADGLVAVRSARDRLGP